MIISSMRGQSSVLWWCIVLAGRHFGIRSPSVVINEGADPPEGSEERGENIL